MGESMETVMGGGHYICEKCGVTTFGSVIHYCKISKDKPMENKVIFESVKEFCDFWFVMLGVCPFPKEIEKTKEKGYIRKII